jgi:hypothetical protein
MVKIFVHFIRRGLSPIDLAAPPLSVPLTLYIDPSGFIANSLITVDFFWWFPICESFI